MAKKGKPPAWDDRIVGHDKVAPSSLLANPKNWRLHPAVQKEALGAAMDRVGLVKSLTVNKRTGFVVDGHLRLTMALDRNQPLVPVEYVDLSEEEEAIVLATVDPIGALCDFVMEHVEEMFRLTPAGWNVAHMTTESILDAAMGEASAVDLSAEQEYPSFPIADDAWPQI